MEAARYPHSLRALCRTGAAAVSWAAAVAMLAGCSAFASPQPAPVRDSSLAPDGPVGYVVCPNAVTPLELATHTAEADIPLPLTGTPVLGDFAIATSPDGRWAYVVTADGEVSRSSTPTSVLPATVPTAGSAAPTTTISPGGAGVRNVVIPIDLETQRAQAPIAIPGTGATHAIVVIDGGRTVLASSGSTIVPVDTASHHVGTPLDLGSGRTIFGMALDPDNPMLYALVAGGVFPVDTANAAVGAEIPTGLAVSSVYSPHGIAITADGTTAYVAGQGGVDFGGRVLPIVLATDATLPAAGFDHFGIADPAALAVTSDGSSLLVADSANNWVNPVPLATFSNPPVPVRLPQRSPSPSTSGTEHPTDIVLGPGHTGAFVVEGFSSVIPYNPVSQKFGRPVTVCSGASSMTVAPAP